jgi:hypothetical protein
LIALLQHLIQDVLSEWCGLFLLTSNFAMHAFEGQYDFRLFCWVWVFGEFEYCTEGIYASSDGRAFIFGRHEIHVLSYEIRGGRKAWLLFLGAPSLVLLKV